MKKKILSIILTLTMVIGSFGVAFAAPVPIDVVGTSYAQAVERLVSLGVLTGYTDDTFRPNNSITREEYAAVAVRAKGFKQEAVNSVGPTIFGDIASGSWATGYIKVAENKGLIKGKGIINGVNTFGPLLNISYEEAITIMVRAIGYESAATANGGWPDGYLIVASQIGLLQNVSGTKGMLATRGMVAKLTYNALEIPMMIKVGANYVVSGTQGTDEVYLFNDLHLINKAAVTGIWGSIDRFTFADAGIVGVTTSNIASLKATLETAANGSNKHWSPSDIQGVFDTLATANKVIAAEAIDTTHIRIKFNTKLDSYDAITTSPYKVSVTGVTFIGTPILSGDEKELILTTSSPMYLNNANLVVEPIETYLDSTVKTERYTKTISYGEPIVELVTFKAGKTSTIEHGIALALDVELENATDSNISVLAGDVTGLIIDKNGGTVAVTGLIPTAFVALKGKTVDIGTINNSIANVGTYTIIVTVKESATVIHTGELTLKVTVNAADIIAAQLIIDAIDALSASPSKLAVQAINYAGLTANQKTLVTNYDELEVFTDDIAAGIVVEGLMTTLTNNKEIKDARIAYNKLGTLGKAEVISYLNLTTAELNLSNAKQAISDAINLAQPLYNLQKSRLDTFTPADILAVNTTNANGFTTYNSALGALKNDLDAAKAINLNADATTIVAITGAEGTLTAQLLLFNPAKSIFDGLSEVISIGK